MQRKYKMSQEETEKRLMQLPYIRAAAQRRVILEEERDRELRDRGYEPTRKGSKVSEFWDTVLEDDI